MYFTVKGDNVETQTTEKFESWCICELMGHNVIAGFVTEQVLGGAALIRVDVPEVDEGHPAFTKLLSANAIYAITPTTEQHARQAAAQIRVRPVTLYILPEPARALAMRDLERDGPDYGSNYGDDHDDPDDDDNPF